MCNVPFFKKHITPQSAIKTNKWSIKTECLHNYFILTTNQLKKELLHIFDKTQSIHFVRTTTTDSCLCWQSGCSTMTRSHTLSVIHLWCEEGPHFTAPLWSLCWHYYGRSRWPFVTKDWLLLKPPLREVQGPSRLLAYVPRSDTRYRHDQTIASLTGGNWHARNC